MADAVSHSPTGGFTNFLKSAGVFANEIGATKLDVDADPARASAKHPAVADAIPTQAKAMREVLKLRVNLSSVSEDSGTS